jgi:hypothetical protein
MLRAVRCCVMARVGGGESWRAGIVEVCVWQKCAVEGSWSAKSTVF